MSSKLYKSTKVYVDRKLENKPFVIAAVPAFSKEAR